MTLISHYDAAALGAQGQPAPPRKEVDAPSLLRRRGSVFPSHAPFRSCRYPRSLLLGSPNRVLRSPARVSPPFPCACLPSLPLCVFPRTQALQVQMKLTPNRDEIWVTGASGNKVVV